MSTTPSSVPPEAPAPRRRKRWLDWLLIVVGLGLIGVYAAQKLRYHEARKAMERDVLPGFAEAERIPLAPGEARGYNVLVITLDTTRGDALHCYNNPNIRTPHLDSLAQQGVIFAQAYTSSPTTLPGHSSILTGLYPHHHGARSNGTFSLPPEVTTLAETLSGAGYATAAFISAYVLDSRFGLDQGFELYDDDLTKGVKHSDQSFRERPAEFTNERFFAWLDTQPAEQSFFAWVHYFDAHMPYLAPEPFRSEYGKRAYEGELAYVDSQIGILLEKLQAKGVRDRTIIVVAGDHGEGHGEHGETTHGLLIYGGTMRVPLIVHVPGKLSGLAVHRPVCTVNVVPTVLDLLGLEVGAGYDGASMLRDPKEWPDAVYGENIATLVLHGWSALFSIREGPFRYIHGPKPELFNLDEDRGEQKNLLGDPKYDAEVARLSAKLHAFLGGDDYGRGALAQMVTMDTETAQRLRALGYVATKAADDVKLDEAAVVDPKDMVEHWSVVQKAAHLMEAGELGEAVKLFEAALAEMPNDVYALRSLGNAYYLSGDYPKAKETAERAYALEKHDPGIPLTLSDISIRMGDLDAAADYLRQAEAMDPSFGGTYIGMAELAIRRGRLQEAERLFRVAIDKDPGSSGPKAYNGLGQMYLGMGSRAKARECFEAALKIDELNGNARAGLANLLAEDGQHEEAQRMFAEAVRFQPAQPFALAALAGLLDQKGEYEEARKYAERSLALQADFIPALNNLALIEKHLGNLARAVELLRRVKEISPSHVVARINLAQCYYAQRDKDAAAGEYEEILAINPHVPQALGNLAAFNLERGRTEEGQALLERALAADPNYAFAHAQYGALLLKQGQAEKALHHLKKSLELDPDQEARGQIEHQVESLEEALGREAPDGPSPGAGAGGPGGG